MNSTIQKIIDTHNLIGVRKIDVRENGTIRYGYWRQLSKEKVWNRLEEHLEEFVIDGDTPNQNEYYYKVKN